MTPEQVKTVEEIVNDKIAEDLPVSMETTTLENATVVRERWRFLVTATTKSSRCTRSETIQKRCAAGPMYEHTGTLGRFRIVKEQSSSQGVRRIKAVLE